MIDLLLVFFTALLISFCAFWINVFFSKFNPNDNKLSPYECGFNPFPTTHDRSANINFYMIAILFIVFDVEIILCLPWVLQICELGYKALISIMFFISMISVGFIYEWKKGGFQWN